MVAAERDSTGLCGGLVNEIALLSATGVSQAPLHAAGQQGLLFLSGLAMSIGRHRRVTWTVAGP